MSKKPPSDVWQGTLALMVLRTLETLGPLHGYGIAKRIEQTSQALSLNYGTLYPALLKLEQEGYIRSSWGLSENKRQAKFYELTAAGRRRSKEATREWHAAATIVARFLPPGEPTS
jgi:PadR family transcriptional regulator PadR